MSWMVGRNHYTVPVGRLDLGRKPNINIHTEKIYNNYGSGYSPMPFGMYGGGFGYGYNTMPFGMYGGFDYGAGFGYYDPGLTKGEKWMLGLGGVATIGGAILSAFTGQTKTPELEETASNIELTEKQEAQLAEIKKKQEAATARYEKLLAENKELKERAALYSEGIEKNDDGTYTASIKDVFGQTQTIKASSLEDIRESKKEKEEEISKQKEFCASNEIKVGSNGEFSKTVKTSSGEEKIFTAKTPEEVLQQIEAAKSDPSYDGNYLA